jgi:heme/copper-type cytochrome/quinol oxidase subunit 3
LLIGSGVLLGLANIISPEKNAGRGRIWLAITFLLLMGVGFVVSGEMSIRLVAIYPLGFGCFLLWNLITEKHSHAVDRKTSDVAQLVWVIIASVILLVLGFYARSLPEGGGNVPWLFLLPGGYFLLAGLIGVFELVWKRIKK